MSVLRFTVAVLPLLGALTAQPAEAGEPLADTSLQKEVEHYLAEANPAEGDPKTFRAFFKEGLNFATADGAFKMKIGGRLMWDSVWRSSDDYGGSVTEDGTFFRRIRLAVSGSVYRNTIFKVQLEFAGQSEVAKEDTGDGSGGTTKVGSTSLKDVYVGLRKLPVVGTFRAGHQYEPFGLEEQTSSKYITFMERSAPGNAFVPSRNVGILFHDNALDGDRLYWGAGLFRTSDSQGRQVEDGGYSFTFRITGLVIEDDEKEMLVHAGFALSLRDPPGESVRFRTRPGTGSGPRLVDTGSLSADDVTLFAFELAVVWRSFSAQFEFFMADVSAVSGPDPGFAGWYVEVAYWITGEQRRYKKSSATFGRVKPKRNFHNDSGPGAWQIALRWDTTDLNDGAITGGEQDTITVGLNWHWNPNARVMFNAVFADVDDGSVSRELTVFQTRFQIDF